METDVQQSKRRRAIVIEVTDREWALIRTANIYTNTTVGKACRELLLRWAAKYQAPPPDKEDNELTSL